MHLSPQSSKKRYKKLVKRLTSNRDSSHSQLGLSDEESFYDEDSQQSEISAEDEDLKNYVKDFRKKVLARDQVQEKFNQSEANRHYAFPRRRDAPSDSEQSIQSLECVLYYDLKKQNDDKPIDENDQLVELLYSIGKMDKQAIREEVE